MSIDDRTPAARKADRLRKERRARLDADPTVVMHGTYSTYINWCCRCDDCRAAARRYWGRA